VGTGITAGLRCGRAGEGVAARGLRRRLRHPAGGGDARGTVRRRRSGQPAESHWRSVRAVRVHGRRGWAAGRGVRGAVLVCLGHRPALRRRPAFRRLAVRVRRGRAPLRRPAGPDVRVQPGQRHPAAGREHAGGRPRCRGRRRESGGPAGPAGDPAAHRRDSAAFHRRADGPARCGAGPSPPPHPGAQLPDTGHARRRGTGILVPEQLLRRGPGAGGPGAAPGRRRAGPAGLPDQWRQHAARERIDVRQQPQAVRAGGRAASRSVSRWAGGRPTAAVR